MGRGGWLEFQTLGEEENNGYVIPVMVVQSLLEGVVERCRERH